MGVRLERKKKRHLLASLLYRLTYVPIPAQLKLRLFLDLEWIFNRLSNEIGKVLFTDVDHPWRLQAVTFIRKHLPSGAVVLDLGCGYGEIAKAVASDAQEVLGVDHDRSKIEFARKENHQDNVTFACSDAARYLSDSGRSFDVLILSHVLEHIDNPRRFLRTYVRFFKFVYIEVPDFDATVLNHFRKDLRLTLNHTDNDHVNEFDRSEMSELLTECGLEVMDREYIFGIQRYWCRV